MFHAHLVRASWILFTLRPFKNETLSHHAVVKTKRAIVITPRRD